MTNINKKQHQELISDLKQLIKVIEIMRQDDTELDIKRIQLLRKFADKLSNDISNC